MTDLTVGIRPTGGVTPRIAVVGGGLAGLSTAALLTTAVNADIVLYERKNSFGGRAADDSRLGEHCPRLLLGDYVRTREMLGRIPSDAGTIADSVTRIRRMEWGLSGDWIELSHMNRFRASELSLRDHLAMYRSRRRPPLVAGTYGPNRNVIGPKRQYSLRTLVDMVTNVWRADGVYAFPGSTDRFLISPVVDHLRRHGVTLHTGVAVDRVVNGHGADDEFDAVVLALFPSDLAAVLATSGVPHGLDERLTHAHCKVMTVDLDPRERVLHDARPQLYCRSGFLILVQPLDRRCVVLCTRVRSTDDDYVLAMTRELLTLEHGFGRVRGRENRAPGDAVWSATMPRARDVLPVRPHGLHIAGSWLACGYPYDSAESAVRSAHRAVDELLVDMARSRVLAAK